VSERIQAIRGMNDILPEATPLWRYVESVFEYCVMQYGYDEIRFPIVENTALFARTIGEVTDIVEKEMYTFADRNGDSLTLRPEGTAGCVRACIEQGLLYNQQQKLWYRGPVFRYEKPQRGRYRQFTQMGVEAFGYSGIEIELELLAICQRLWRMLGLADIIHLQVNTLGDAGERLVYRQKLTQYFESHWNALDEDSKRRLDKNPLRILDSKNPQMQTLIQQAPKLIETLGAASLKQFNNLCRGLERLNISYTVNSALVRGLDYYGGLVFEWVSEHLGSQSAVCAGGRFDRLVEQFSGPPTPAIGFALGQERLILLLETQFPNETYQQDPFFYFIAVGDEAVMLALTLAETLRDQFPEAPILVNTTQAGLKSQFKKADKSGAGYALIIGENELATNSIGIKNLRVEIEQVTIPQNQLVAHLMAMEESSINVSFAE
jgi:histidyl-tRNA synthetase